MTSPNDQAFPTLESLDAKGSGNSCDYDVNVKGGLTKRELIAALSTGRFLASDENSAKMIAKSGRLIADALIAELNE